MQVNHSQAISPQPLEPWLLVKQDGMVKAAHCTCMAGLGEACSHIGTLLFYLEAACVVLQCYPYLQCCTCLVFWEVLALTCVAWHVIYITKNMVA